MSQRDGAGPRTNILLIGAGHTHLYVVAHAAELSVAGYRVTLIAPPDFRYSGVASASAVGALPAAIGQIDVAALADRFGISYHPGTVVGLDHERRVAIAEDGTELPYDIASFNIGSIVDPVGMEIEDGVLRVKPLTRLAGLSDLLDEKPGGSRVTVVGGGSSGVELAAHLAVREDVRDVRLIEAGPDIGSEVPARAAHRLERVLRRRGVDLVTGCPVAFLGERTARCADGREFAHDVGILATGLAAPGIVSELGLGDRHGIPVRATLQHRDHDDLYAAGDCANFLPRPLPRVGVHGVQQGPVLLASLLARAAGEPLPTYEPQSRYLSILDLGGGTALAARGNLW